MRTSLRCLLGSLLTVCSLPTAHATSSYAFSEVAGQGSVIGGVTLGTFNNVGAFWVTLGPNNTVAFWNDSSIGGAMFTATSLVATVGEVIGGQTLQSIGGLPYAVGGGGVVFYDPPSETVFSQSAVIGHSLERPLDISANGTALYDPSQGVYQTQFGVAANFNVPVFGLSFGPRPVYGAVNDTGQAAFISSTATTVEVITPSGLIGPGSVLGGITITSIVSSGLAINDAGTVVFEATYNGGASDGIFNQYGLISDVSSDGALRGISINDFGEVAWSTLQGYFTQNGKVLGLGDTILGETVTEFDANMVDSRFLNDSGNLAFGVFLNGAQFVVMATDTSTPEPGTSALLLVGLAGIVGWRRKTSVRVF